VFFILIGKPSPDFAANVNLEAGDSKIVSVEKMEAGSQRDQGQDSSSVQDATSALAAVTQERDQLAAEKAELQDRILRAQAEFQNLKRRTERERVELFEYAATEAVRVLIAVLDDFERASKAPSADKEYGAGIELIYNRFYETLKKLGLEPIVSQGQPFDPQIHHAVDMVETEEAPDHTVLDEFQRGYNFKGRMLRPAMVKVAVKPSQK
jgi:molecular chaperone GrpE